MPRNEKLRMIGFEVEPKTESIDEVINDFVSTNEPSKVHSISQTSYQVEGRTFVSVIIAYEVFHPTIE